MAQVVTDEQAGFRGGYFAGASLTQLPNQFGNVVTTNNTPGSFANMRVLPSGDITSRPAIVSLTPSATPVPTGENEGGCGFYWRRAGGTPKHLLVCASASPVVNHFDTFSLTNNGAGVIQYSGTTSTTPGTSFSTTVPQCYVHFRDSTTECVYIADGQSKLSKWDGTTLSVGTIGVALNLTYIWVYNQRLFGITGSDQTLYWSALNNGDTLGDVANGGGFATIRTFGGGNLIAGCAVGASTLLFHQQGISIFTGTTLDDISVTAGTQGHTPDFQLLGSRSFCVVGGVCYAVGKQGLFLINESECTAYEHGSSFSGGAVTDLIRVELQGASTLSTVEVLAVHNPRATEVLFLNNTTGNWYGYNYRLGILATHATPTVSGTVTSAWLGDDANGAPVVLVSIGTRPAALYAFDAATTTEIPTTGRDGDQGAGTQYAGHVWFRRLATAAPYVAKSWRRLRLFIEWSGGSPEVFAYQPQNSIAMTDATLTAAASTTSEYVVQLGGISTALDVKVAAGAGSRTTIHRALVEGYVRGWGGAG